jgi:hypothetical protein
MASHPAGSALVEEVEETTYLLDANDRCDNCGAQAYFRCFFDGGTLDFCNHHFTLYQDTLQDIMLDFIDESERLHGQARN